ncbi:MAG: hypothetical protein Q9159_006240 [Coniocarpon cinnabarinum]
MPPKIISVIGGLDYDLIMISTRIPDRGESILANEYLETLGGKALAKAREQAVLQTQPSSDEKPVLEHEHPGDYSDDGLDIK